MDDWQETQLTTRHVHNRVGKGTRSRGGGGGAFDVKKLLGTYEVKCPAAAKLSTRDNVQELPRKLEIYTVNERGNAIIGELILGGAFHAVVLLAGSRKTMNAVVKELEEVNEKEEEGEGEHGEEESRVGTGEEGVGRDAKPGPDNDDDDNDDDDEGDSDENEDDEDAIANQRFREFEKNTFRSPKFWLKWQGSVLLQAAASNSDSSTSDQSLTGTGYFVFSGNQCNRLQGTLSCERLEWDNVKISGMKLRSQPARDFALTWHAG